MEIGLIGFEEKGRFCKKEDKIKVFLYRDLSSCLRQNLPSLFSLSLLPGSMPRHLGGAVSAPVDASEPFPKPTPLPGH